MFLVYRWFNFVIFSILLTLTKVSSQLSAIPGGNPPGDRQSAVGKGDAGFEPGTAGQQSGAPPRLPPHHGFLKLPVFM
jgi:hypothetical protein